MNTTTQKYIEKGFMQFNRKFNALGKPYYTERWFTVIFEMGTGFEVAGERTDITGRISKATFDKYMARTENDGGLDKVVDKTKDSILLECRY